MTTNVPEYVRCGPAECQGHEYDPSHTYVLQDVLPGDLEDRGAEVAMALAASVTLHWGAEKDGQQYEPGLTIHKGPISTFDGREWCATAVRGTP